MKRNIYWIVTLIFLIATAASAEAQGNFTWNNLGPDNMGSLTRALVVDQSGNLLAGSQGGGLWTSSNRGHSWERVVSYDQAGCNPNVTAIAVDPNSDKIYVATGASAYVLSYFVSDLNFNSSYDFRDVPEGFKGYLRGLPGGGIYISDDGGSSWSPAPATNDEDTRNYKGPFVSIQSIKIAGNIIYVGTAEGLYYSTDGLASLTKSTGSEAFETAIVFDVEVSGNNVFAGVHNPQNALDDSLYISTNAGMSFTSMTDDIFFSNGKFSFNGVRIASAPSDENIIYVGATSASGGLNSVYRSDNNGDAGTWRRYGPQGGPGFRPLNTTGRNAFILEVFPDNSDELIVAGNNWYTFIEGQGWTQTAQHVLPFFPDYITRNMYSVAFLNDSTFFIGTDRQIIRSTDRGQTFTQQSKGYEAAVTYSVSAVGLDQNPGVMATTSTIGSIYNRNYATELPSNQGFGVVNNFRFGDVACSYLYPGGIITQGSDDGLVRSLNFGEAFERFYGPSINPQVANLVPAGSDTLIDRPNASSGGGSLFNSGGAAQAPFVLNEVIPASFLDNTGISKDEMQAQAPNYVFFASKEYIWVVNGSLGDGLKVKWNRISNQLVNGITEYFTSMGVSSDTNRTVYVGSSQGGLWRLDRPHDLANYDAVANVTAIHEQPTAGLIPMNGRWLSTVAVDPQNPDNVAIGFAGYGGNVQATLGFVWYSENATSANPEFKVINALEESSSQVFPKEPVYSLKFVEDPSNGQSVLLVGSESGLYSFTSIMPIPGAPLVNARWKSEFGDDFGKVPVFDIDVRLYKSTIRDEETQDFTLSKDNTVFVATHGRGIWSTSDLVFAREGDDPELPVDIEEIAISLYPNPHSGQADLAIELVEAAELSYQVFDIQGRQVMATAIERLPAGNQILPVDFSRLNAGVYFVDVAIKTDAGVINKTIKMIKSQ